jgi:uncharacterized protein YaiI (UPF0178 family)
MAANQELCVVKIWIDADACPRAIKDVVIRAAERLKIPTTFVANSYQTLPRSAILSFVQVPKGFDVADSYVLAHCEEGDVVVTQDIPLAAELVAKKVHALNPRGEHYTENNIRERLNMRDFMDSMRGAGMATGGPPPFHEGDVKLFSNSFDRLLTKVTRK